MNTQIAVHPRLHHYGLTTAKLDAMVEWYCKALGMTVIHRSEVRAVQRSILSPFCHRFRNNDAGGEAEDSRDRKSLNLCEAAETLGGRLEVVGSFSVAAGDNP